MGSKRKRGAKNSSGDAQPSHKKSKKGHKASDAPNATPSAPSLDLDKSSFSEHAAGDERKREATLYELLGSLDASERIAAADAVITGLLASSESAFQRHLEKRLFRGLASSRNASRVGFSLVLTELFRHLFQSPDAVDPKFPGLTFDVVLDLLVEKTKPNGTLPGQEEKDLYFGQLFGLQCFVESKVLFLGDSSRWSRVMGLLLELASKKVWMRSQCAWLIVEALPQMGQEKASETMQELVNIGLGKTAEGVGIWLKALTCYPSMKMPSKPWGHPLATKSLQELANVLKENVKHDDGSQEVAVFAAKSGNWNATLHFVWDLILTYFIEEAGSKNMSKAEHFQLFWTAVIDAGLFSKTATEGQKFRGLMIFQKFIQALATKGEHDAIKALFSRNLMRCIMNQAVNKDRYLHRAALKSLKTLEIVVEAHPSTLLAILEQLISQHGAYDFDQLTATNTVEHILHHVTAENVKQVFKLLRSPVSAMQEHDKAENLRQFYALYVFAICTQTKTSGEVEKEAKDQEGKVLELSLKELIQVSYSKSDDFSPDLSDKTRQVFRSRLGSALARLTKRRADYRFLCDAVLTVDPSAVPMSAELEVERKAALKTLKKLTRQSQKSDQEEGNASLGLALLYAITILQLYDGEPDAISTLEDLKQCAEKLQDSDSSASALLVEILLSMVSRKSPLMRQITQQVFEAFTSQLSAEALEGLTEHLAAEENLKGQQALFEAEDEEMEDAGQTDGSDDEDEDDMSEIGSDVEFVTLNGNEVDDEGGSDDGSETEETNAQAQDYAKLDDALAKVLGSHRLDQDGEAESSDNDSDMTDSEMMALDDKLAEVFKQRVEKSNKNKERASAKATVVHFKHRVLDFLDIYVKKEAHNPLASRLLVPLLRLIRTTQTKELSKKAVDTIHNFARVSKKVRAGAESLAVDADAQLELLKEIHQEASQDESVAFARAVSAASLVVASGLLAADKESIAQVAAIYAQTQVDWALGKRKIQAVFFTEWVNWCASQAASAKA